MTTATREGIVATYDGTKESGLNGGIVDDGRGADGNPPSRAPWWRARQGAFRLLGKSRTQTGRDGRQRGGTPGASHPTRTRQGEGTFRDERGASREGRKGQDGGERRERRRASDVTPTKSSGVRRNAKGTRTRERRPRHDTREEARGRARPVRKLDDAGTGSVRRGTSARVGRDTPRVPVARVPVTRVRSRPRSARFVLQRVRAERRAQIRGVHANRRESPRGRPPGIGGDGVQNRDEGGPSPRVQTTRTGARVSASAAPLRGVTSRNSASPGSPAARLESGDKKEGRGGKESGGKKSTTTRRYPSPGKGPPHAGPADTGRRRSAPA